ncbi:uncharacterized protein ACR2FA_003037 [Aphomia sociella]
MEERKIVVPASKLQPLPADFVFDVSKLATVSKSLILPNKLKALTSQSPTVNLKVTVGTSVLTQSVKTTISSISKELSPIKSEIETSPTNVIVTMLPALNHTDKIASTKNPILSFNVNSLPKDFLSSNILTKIHDGHLKKEVCDENDFAIGNTDEQPMEIDEDCSLAVVPVTTNDSGKLVFEIDTLKNTKDKHKSNYFDVGLLLSDGSEPQEIDKEKYLVDKLHILKGDHQPAGDESETIVMENDDGTTIIRMAAGQRVLYDGTKFVVADDDQLDEHHDNGDSQDSNEESQIELQVSGDEETANAIIAAAQEQGGAFIKVESGEMYRVKSVLSKADDTDREEDDTNAIQMMVQEENGQFKCMLCENNANSERFVGDAEGTMQHLRTQHAARLYICRVCGRVLRRRHHYTAHLAEHGPGSAAGARTKLHACTVCGRRFTSRAQLREHARAHAGLRPHSCAHCGKSFASKYTHQAHLKTHEARPRPFKCEQCGKTFFTQQNLNQHEKTHLGIKDFICNVCGKAFASQHNLEVHGVTHSGRRPHACDTCGKAFARRAELRDHARVHTGERPFACEVCGATFSQRSNLHSHRRATHLGDKRHACALCPKRFKRRRLLEYHTKAAHTGERPLRCGVCRASFVYPEHFKKHARIHSGEKPYVCEVCGKSFNSRDNRNTHRFVHSDKKPYECFTCGAGYMRKRLLLAHMNSTGHVAESIVVNQPRVIKTVENVSLFIKYMCKSINLIPEGDESLLTLQDLRTMRQGETSIETELEEHIDGQTEMIVTDEDGSIMRLIQIQLPDGKSGWVAIKKPLNESLPNKSAEIRIGDLDDSVTSADVVAAVARDGECAELLVKTGDIRRAPSGAGTVWVRCPVAAAKKLAAAGRVGVGWVSARVRLLPPRPMQCFRCHMRGHVAAKCTAEVDLSGTCFRCGQAGHRAAACSGTITCTHCAAAGRKADHRVGSSTACRPPSASNAASNARVETMDAERCSLSPILGLRVASAGALVTQ